MTITRGSITKGGITNGGILAGGILASQAGDPYSDYDFYLDGTLDRVSGNSLSCLIPGTRYDLVNSVQTAFTTNTPVKTEKGIRTVGAYTNYFLNSGTPTTQSITLAAGTYTLAITGTGSAVYNGNTAVTGTPVTFTLASSTTADCTITGTVLTVMLCQKKYAHPHIPTTSSTAASVSESGTIVAGEATNGIFANNISTNFPLLKAKLNGSTDGSSNIIVNGDFATGDLTGWGANTAELKGFSYSNGALLHNGSSTDAWAAQEILALAASSGMTYELSFDCVSCDTGAIIRHYNPFSASYILTNLSIGNFKTLLTTDGTYKALALRSGSSGKTFLLDNFVLKKLNTSGTISFEWTPGYSAADVTGVMKILSFGGSTSYIAYNKTNGTIELVGVANTATKAITPVANTTYAIKCTWQGTTMQVCVDGSVGTTANFGGSFNPGSDIIVGLDNAELQYVNNLRIFKEPQWV